MKYDYPHLCSPITIAGKTFPHRMFSAPMGGTDITNDGCIGPKSAAFYELRAKGGAAAVTVSECMVHPVTDGSHAYHLDTAVLNSLGICNVRCRCNFPPRRCAEPGAVPFRYVCRNLHDR